MAGTCSTSARSWASRVASLRSAAGAACVTAAAYQHPSSKRSLQDMRREPPLRVPTRLSKSTSAIPVSRASVAAPMSARRSSGCSMSMRLLPASSCGCQPSRRSQAPLSRTKRSSASAVASSTEPSSGRRAASAVAGGFGESCLAGTGPTGPRYRQAQAARFNLSAPLPRPEQAFPQLALVLGRRIERRGVGQRVEAGEAEELLEQLGAAVESRPEARASRLLDQPALEQRADGRLGRHAANSRDLGAGYRLQVGHDREALRLRLRERG